MKRVVWWLLVVLGACGDDGSLPAPVDGSVVDAGVPDGGPPPRFDRSECAGPFRILPNLSAVAGLQVADARRVMAAELPVDDGEILGLYADLDRATPNGFHALGAVDEDEAPIGVILGTGCTTSLLEECDQLWSPRSGHAFVRVSRVDDDAPRFWMTIGELVLTPVTLARNPLSVSPGEASAAGPPCHFYQYVEARIEPRTFSCSPADTALFCELAR